MNILKHFGANGFDQCCPSRQPKFAKLRGDIHTKMHELEPIAAFRGCALFRKRSMSIGRPPSSDGGDDSRVFRLSGFMVPLPPAEVC